MRAVFRFLERHGDNELFSCDMYRFRERYTLDGIVNREKRVREREIER